MAEILLEYRTPLSDRSSHIGHFLSLSAPATLTWPCMPLRMLSSEFGQAGVTHPWPGEPAPGLPAEAPPKRSQSPDSVGRVCNS